MQNFSLLPFLALEIWRRKIPSQEGNKSLNSDIYPGKCILLKKNTVFISRIVLCDQKLAPHVNFINFQAEENVFSFPKFFQCLNDKKQQKTLTDKILIMLW